MPETDAQHRPLVSGIEIKSGRRVNGNLLTVGGGGTLTGLATRTSCEATSSSSRYRSTRASPASLRWGCRQRYRARPALAQQRQQPGERRHACQRPRNDPRRHELRVRY